MRPLRPIPWTFCAALGIAWCAAVVWGFGWLSEYTNTPGASAKASISWPAGATVQRDGSLPTLVLFAHPYCPCTATTVEELDRLLSHCADRVTTRVLIYSDPSLGPEWARGALWDRIARIPGVLIQEDPLGAQAALFGARTSGQVCLYSADGKLLFSGGITPSRGHEGDNLGRTSVLDILDGCGGATTTPVYGCALAAETGGQ